MRALLLSGTGAVTHAASDSAIITLTGRVLANTCTIASGSETQTIQLANVADRDIKGKGTTAGEKTIEMVPEECGTAASAVKVSASGSADADDKTAFANGITAKSDGATGVGLYFYQTDGTKKFNPDGSVTEKSKLTPSENNTLTCKAAYVATKDSITAGEFRTVVNMNFEYE
ncbi:fimbrial protein [Erwinia sp. E602]|uniref:fimbrial protein n=1 Tax=Erwinia sp. E602 TaxID=2675378 RepID=UPI001BA66087|nr:fimbrial protein [Erwinia sp. E602]QUG77039.1 fimbrial protein [Erwinia sp. E602]